MFNDLPNSIRSLIRLSLFLKSVFTGSILLWFFLDFELFLFSWEFIQVCWVDTNCEVKIKLKRTKKIILSYPFQVNNYSINFCSMLSDLLGCLVTRERTRKKHKRKNPKYKNKEN
ncbi:hypothetical protein CN563_23110 [Bacillus sp. AFS026049]|nr:hypothetical protein CN563_23110 [Bacillus sp. AFS026049]